MVAAIELKQLIARVHAICFDKFRRSCFSYWLFFGFFLSHKCVCVCECIVEIDYSCKTTRQFDDFMTILCFVESFQKITTLAYARKKNVFLLCVNNIKLDSKSRRKCLVQPSKF